jgi:uncharacterized membrane protein YdjX (TVP38/TMEM64 family)
MDKKKKKVGPVFWLFITIIPVLGMIWGIIDPTSYDYWQSLSQKYFVKFSIFAPVVFILIQALQVIITPISHYSVGLIGGYLFGFGWGGILNYIGRLIGHSCAFFISKKWGRKIMDKWVDEKIIQQYDRIFAGDECQKGASIQSVILFLIYFLPLFPDDEISYIVGASKMKFRLFFLANLFGHLGGSFSLALIGDGINTKDPWFWILTLVTLVGFPIIWLLLRLNYKRKK